MTAASCAFTCWAPCSAFTAGVRIKMFVISPFESLGMAMATYTGHNYGAVKPERIWQGIKVAAGLMLGLSLIHISEPTRH